MDHIDCPENLGEITIEQGNENDREYLEKRLGKAIEIGHITAVVSESGRFYILSGCAPQIRINRLEYTELPQGFIEYGEDDICDRFIALINSQSGMDLSDLINGLGFENSEKKLSDTRLIHKLTERLDSEDNKEELWEKLLLHIDMSAFDDRCFNYFYENDLCLCTLVHMVMEDKYLKKLAHVYDEAYIRLAKRYYGNYKYSVSDFAGLLKGCKFESVFENLFTFEKYISPKGIVLHKVIEENPLLSPELKDISRRIYKAKMLMCTDDMHMIEEYFNKNDYIYMAAISRNPFAPKDILNALTQVSNVKYASHIREQSRETLKLING
ncbi:MAG: hypothetical protein K2K57_02535 [Oscillospiraceae bacterium]|nr:hypothetical protein [Oscillospiraceae bacterium]